MRNPTSKIGIGHRVEFSKKISERDVEMIAEATGDRNPLHLNEDYARATIFGERIVHGILTLGLVSAALSRLPGLVVYLSQTAKFLRPVRIGDTVRAVAEVVEIDSARRTVRLRTTCLNQRGKVVLEGEALVKIFKEPRPQADR